MGADFSGLWAPPGRSVLRWGLHANSAWHDLLGAEAALSPPGVAPNPNDFGLVQGLQSLGGMLRVRDLMTTPVSSVSPTRTLEYVAWKLATERISGVAVKNAAGDVLGVVSKSDLADPSSQEDRDRHVEDVMTPNAWAVAPDDSAIAAVRMMLAKEVHRVLVIQGEKLVGIVTATDVIRALDKGWQFIEAPTTAVEHTDYRR